MNEKIRVGFLTPTLLFGGAERWVAALAAGLDPSRFQVVGVAIRDAGKLFPAIADKVSRRCPILEGPASFAALAADCDVLIAWGLPDLGMLAGFRGRVVFVGHGHCEWSVNCIRSCAAHVTDWAAVSKLAADSFPDPSRVAVVHNGIDADRCAPERTREQIRSAWGVEPGEIAVGYVGRMSAEKNPLAAVEAVQWLRVEGRESRGSGPSTLSRVQSRESRGSGLSTLDSRLSTLDSGLSTLNSRHCRAVLVGDGPGKKFFLEKARAMAPDTVYQLPVENVGDVYRALDCFVLASRFEGFSLALAEAWYCACPTVATPVGATELADLHGTLCVRVPAGCCPRELARAVRTAISPENRSTVAHAARVVAAHYTAEAMCRRWERYLESVAAQIAG